MRRRWTPEELETTWSLQPCERALLANKTGATLLGFVVILKFFQIEGRFPASPQEIPEAVIPFLANQIGIESEVWSQYQWKGRAFEYHRSLIRRHLGFREATIPDAKELENWLRETVLPVEQRFERLRESLYHRCRVLRIEPPAMEQIRRLIRAAQNAFEKSFCNQIFAQLSAATLERLNAWIQLSESETPEEQGMVWATYIQNLRSDPGKPGLKAIHTTVTKLHRIRDIGLLSGLFNGVSQKLLQSFRRRIAVEEPYELRRHDAPLRATLLAAYAYLRGHEITDQLVDLLIASIHRMASKAERRIENELAEGLRKISGKLGILFRMAEAALKSPKGQVEQVIFPVASERLLLDLLQEAKSKGPAFRKEVRAVMKRAFQSHHRRMLPELLTTLEFRSSNELHHPILNAIAVIKSRLDQKGPFWLMTNEVPIDGVVSPSWKAAVIGKDAKGCEQIDRTAYELCVLQALRVRLRCREIWVVGAHRYRNPDEDLPQDFETHRQAYYEALGLPLEPETLINQLREKMKSGLQTLDKGLPDNPYVKILPKGWIHLSPLEAQTDPEFLLALKGEIGRRWPMTSLLDVLKETDLRIGFTREFQSGTEREHLARTVLQPRLLLCLYALGTNTGLKRMASGQEEATHKDLLYVRRRFITAEQLRRAITQVVNATMSIRQPNIWGEATTACASDSKQFGAWDQNLLTEWHVRYGGRGVMVYWHVAQRSTCIYSQLKNCSSSEAGAMIEGVLRHCTEMTVKRQYVDSHGQSEVAFAFCHLLGFQLMPRLKAIPRQRLYRPGIGMHEAFPALQPILSRPIDWDLIREYYDIMVKYATALRLGTADAENILRRFTRSNLQHPVYKALAELGKAIKTIFLCRYLHEDKLRREVNEGLNVVENWNSANGFIFYGKSGELATNRRDDQEIGLLSLHLLQVCLVYVNTLMIQKVLAEPVWMQKMTTRDLAALSPLTYHHINPYGKFDLDLNTRLPSLDEPQEATS